MSGLDDISPGTDVLIDGTRGTVTISPDAAEANAAVETAAAAAAAMAGWAGPGATADGHLVAILANVQDGSAARSARETPAEGIGLFRTELCFLNRDTEPSVDEQAAIYGEVLDAFAGCKVVIRTLDAGSDKPLKFVGHPDEANPALGVRGNRIEAIHPEVLERQLDAIAAAASNTGNPPWVMAPMIATPDEAKRFADRARARNLVPGVMIEIPAAALLAHRILEHVEFLSIGTNDLAQYTMAADRMSAELATLTDPWQPGVLALVAQTARAGVAVRQAGRGVRRSCRRPAAGLCADRDGRDVAVGGRRRGDRCRRQAGLGDAAAVPRCRRGGADNGQCGRGARRCAGSVGVKGFSGRRVDDAALQRGGGGARLSG